MFTGFAPGRFRRENPDPEKGVGHYYFVGPEEVLLAEQLVEKGYRVEARVENRTAFQGRSFQGFTDVKFGSKRREAAKERWAEAVGYEEQGGRADPIWWLVDRLLGDLENTDDQKKKRPFFYLHWFDDPHAAYNPPLSGDDELQLSNRELPHPLALYLKLGHKGRPKRGRFRMRDLAPNFSPTELQLIQDLYRLEIESVDQRIGWLLKALELSGERDNTVVLFTSDHGEGFGEHGDFLHGVSLYDEMMRVPLILAGPGIPKSKRVPTPVSHLDLVPTLASILGVTPKRAVGMPGENLVPSPTTDLSESRSIYLSSPDRLAVSGIVSGRWKLIAEKDGLNPQLFDLIEDPLEKDNLASELPDETKRLLRILQKAQLETEAQLRQRKTLTSEEAEKIQRETEEQLRAVGYIN